MRVLHFIPNFADITESVCTQYKITLIKVMAESAEVHLLCADEPTVDLGNVYVHKFSLLKNLFGIWYSTFDRFLKDIRPDVVHIHACWDIYAYYFQKRCNKFRIPTIITFDRQLEVWHVSSHYWGSKFLKVLIYQRYLISHAQAFHAVCENEVQSIAGFIGYPKYLCKILGFKSGNIEKNNVEKLYKDIYTIKYNNKIRNIVVVDTLNNIITSQTMSERIFDMYQTVLDSNPFMMMDSDNCYIEDILLHAGISEETNLSNMLGKLQINFSSLTSESWRMILLHSNIQGILDLVLSGIQKYGLSQPYSKKSIEDIYCFPIDDKQCYDIKMYTRNIMSDNTIPVGERNILIQIITILYGIKHHINIKRKDFIDLYCGLKYNNFDESLLYKKAHEAGILKSAARLFYIMKERYGLGEGFMFTEPINDRGTKKLRKIIFKSNIQ